MFTLPVLNDLSLQNMTDMTGCSALLPSETTQGDDFTQFQYSL